MTPSRAPVADAPAPRAAPVYHIVLDVSRRLGRWDGWGCSLAWWANVFGRRRDMADVLFTRRALRLTTNTGTYALPGLELNIVRYNIGGTSSAPALGAHDRIPARMPPFKQIQGFWLDPTNSDPRSSSFDWSADANQRAMLQMARRNGADLLEAFSDTPMWWMCRNQSSAGGDGGADNLKPDQEVAFARYLAAVVRYAQDHWSVRFDSIEPFNEPGAWWWIYPSGQEGCHFSVPAQDRVIVDLRRELDRQNLRAVGLTASDENSPDQALRTWTALASPAKRDVAKVTTHGYSGTRPYRGPDRIPLYQAVAASGRPLWMSEYGDGDSSGRSLAESILLDLNRMRASGWVYWQPFDSGAWGLVQSNPGDQWVGPPNPKYFVLAQFTRHIREGMRLLDTGDADSAAAFDLKGGRLAVVVFNSGPARQARIDLPGFSAGGSERCWVTKFDGSELYAPQPEARIGSSALTALLQAGSIETFEVRAIQRSTAACAARASRRPGAAG